MWRAAIKKRIKREVQKMWHGDMNKKRIWNGRFNCTKKCSLLSTGGLHAIHLLCWNKWIAHCFFDSEVESFPWAGVEEEEVEAVVEAWALAAFCLKIQSWTLWPFLPQNKHKSLSIQRCCSCWVSLPQESNFPVRSSFVDCGFGASFGLLGFEPEAWEVDPELDRAILEVNWGVVEEVFDDRVFCWVDRCWFCSQECSW